RTTLPDGFGTGFRGSSAGAIWGRDPSCWVWPDWVADLVRWRTLAWLDLTAGGVCPLLHDDGSVGSMAALVSDDYAAAQIWIGYAVIGGVVAGSASDRGAPARRKKLRGKDKMVCAWTTCYPCFAVRGWISYDRSAGVEMNGTDRLINSSHELGPPAAL
ncbi:hypothetical protein ACLOJK_034760, partial [Asimina triloba]